MSGFCGKDASGHEMLCPNNTRAFTPDFDVSSIVPALAGGKVCCTKEQFENTVAQTGRSAPIFGPCPACYRNFRELWGTYACSPDQSTFVDVVGVNEHGQVNHTAYTVGGDYAYAAFKSCDKVRSRATGGYVMALFGSPKTPEAWFQFMGNAPFPSPYQIDVTVVNGTSAPSMYAPTHPCDTDAEGYTCSAFDCPPSTPPNERFQEALKLRAGSSLIDPAYLYAAGVFVAFLSALSAAKGFGLRQRGGRAVFFGAAVAGAATVAGFALYAGHSVRRETVLVSVTTPGGTSDYDLGGDVRVLESNLSYGLFVPASLLLGFLTCTVLVASFVWGKRGGRREGGVQVEGGVVRPSSSAAPTASSPSRPSSSSSSSSSSSDSSTASEGGNHHSRQRRSALYPAFAALARFSSRRPALVIACGLALTAACGSGISQMEVETKPVKMWAPTGSEVVRRMNEFDATFGPFYRPEQMIVKTTDGSPIVTPRNLVLLDQLQARLEAVTAQHDGRTVEWEDICYRPIPGKGCVRETVTEYFYKQGGVNSSLTPAQVDEVLFNSGKGCAYAITEPKCRGHIGALVFPYVAFGGYDEVTADYAESTALVSTYPVLGDTNLTEAAEAWEREALKLLAVARRDLRAEGLELSYNLGVSVEEEIKRSSGGAAVTVGASYLVMFLYISLSLGRLYPWNSRLLLVRTRFLLGFGAIVIVVCSLVISLGLCSFAGVKMTPIIAEVIPFLVLAVGIDNVFVLLNAFQGMDPRRGVEERLEETLGTVGVSVTLAAVSECFAFLLGGLTRMPAVQAFAFYSGVAIMADYLLQITVFVALMGLDARRRAALRVDCVPCAQLGGGDGDEAELHATDYRESGSGALVLRDGVVKRGMRRHCLPVMTHRGVRAAVLVAAVGAAAVSAAYAYHNLELGLDQKQAVPHDSYLQGYFTDLATVLRVGPPVYFVVRPTGPAANFSTFAGQDTICAGAPGCGVNSVSQFEAAANAVSTSSYLADASNGGGPTLWINDYFSFLIPPSSGTGGGCCSVNKTTGEYCDPADPSSSGCEPCAPASHRYSGNDTSHDTRVLPQYFEQHLRHFLYNTSCSEYCGSCGWAHASNVLLGGTSGGRVAHSRAMNFQAPLKTQADFINAYRTGTDLAKTMSEKNGLDVYAYSVFHPFFAQYLFMRRVTATSAGAAMAVALVMCLLFCPPRTSLCVVLSIAMAVVDLTAVCAAWNIKLNAVSAVNISVSVGIYLEFHVHVAVAFSRATGSRVRRVRAAMLAAGNSVLQGVFLTKLLGVAVLGFASSKLIRVYYFEMLLAIVLLGALHGLVVLPALLCAAGSGARAEGRKGGREGEYVPLANAAAAAEEESYGTF